MQNLLFVLLLALTIGYGMSQLEPHSNLPEAIANIVIHFSHQEPEIFDCWFLDAEEEHIGSIVSSPTIAHIPKVLASISTLSLQNIRKPSLLVLNANTFQERPLSFVLSLFHSTVVLHDTKILALIEFQDFNQIKRLHDLLFVKIVWNVVYVDVRYKQALYYNPFKKVFLNWRDLNPEFMFTDLTSNLYGTLVRFSLIGTSPWCTVLQPFIKNGLVKGSICKWITETLRRVNGSWLGVQVYCNPGYRNCTEKLIKDDNGNVYELQLNCYSKRKMTPIALELTEPVRLVIVAPRGRILEMFELFTYPFNIDLWTLILVLVIACALTTTVFPRLFENDPFLLSLCGFERYSLHRATAHEKIILFSLITLFFFITSIYENKFISLMTSYPRVRDPETLDDLRQTGVKVATGQDDMLSLEYRFPDPDLRSLIEVFEQHFESQSKTMAFISEARMARGILYSADYTDHTTGVVNYIPLKHYSVNLRVSAIGIKARSPYRTLFWATEQRFSDAGLMGHWFEEVLIESLQFRNPRDLSKIDDLITVKNINVWELKPVWMGLLSGWIIGVSVLIVEIIWRTLAHRFTARGRLFYSMRRNRTSQWLSYLNRLSSSFPSLTITSVTKQKKVKLTKRMTSVRQK